jgi:hypothetical protein
MKLPLPQVQTRKPGAVVYSLEAKASTTGFCVIIACLLLFAIISAAAGLAQTHSGKIAVRHRACGLAGHPDSSIPGPGEIVPVAGGGPNNWPAVSSAIGYPGAVAEGASGNLYTADSHSSRVFQVDNSGHLTVIAGTGFQGYSGDGGPATTAELNQPSGIQVRTSLHQRRQL